MPLRVRQEYEDDAAGENKPHQIIDPEDVTISPVLYREREIRMGQWVAYGHIRTDGTCSVNHAPTQVDFGAVAAAIDGMSPEQIAAAIERETA